MMNITPYEKNSYFLNDKKDLVILSKIKHLESLKLRRNDEEVVKLIKSQLKKDWRTPLISYLNYKLRRYKR